MKDELINEAELPDAGSPDSAPETAHGTSVKADRSNQGQISRGQRRRLEDEGVLVTRWGFTCRAATLRLADAVAQRIATPRPRPPGAGRQTRGRWAFGGAVAAAAAYARSRGWL